MKFKDILVLLLIFIIGSLIVNFLISPNSFDSFKDNMKSITQNTNYQLNTNDQEDNYVEVDMLMNPSCSILEVGAKANNVGEYEIKEKECTLRCGQENLDYHHFECDKDKLHCYCLQGYFSKF